MEVSRNYEKIQKAKLGSAVTIGTYDGVHLGHRKLISELCKIAHSRDLCSVVLTFEPHPASVVRPESAPLLLTGLEQKLEQLEKTGVELVQIIEFDEKRAEESAEEFVKEVLVETLNAKVVAVGEDFHFGKNREGNVKLLEQIGKEENFEIHSLELLGINETLPTSENQISSTAIREALLNGDLEKANMMLGRPYEVRGHVTEGDSRGRELGFPTANIRPDSTITVPGNGIYATLVEIDGKSHKAATSIGVRPTFETSGIRTIEAFLLDFDGDLYGQQIQIEFISRTRSEIAFESTEKLTRQMNKDVDEVRNILAK